MNKHAWSVNPGCAISDDRRPGLVQNQERGEPSWTDDSHAHGLQLWQPLSDAEFVFHAIMTDQAGARKILQELIKRDDLKNKICCDCSNPNPQWASLRFSHIHFL